MIWILLFSWNVWASNCESQLTGRPQPKWINLEQDGHLRRLYEKQGASGPLWAAWEAAYARWEDIEQAAKNADKEDQKPFEQIRKAVLAALTKHQVVYAGSTSPGSLDIPRHAEILKSIADFDPNRSRYSFYKIKRAIEGRYALNEYITCR